MDTIFPLLPADEEFFRLINQTWANGAMDTVMPFISDPKPFLPYLGAGSLLFLTLGGFRGRLFVLLMLLALGIGDAGINCSIKHAVHRPRPYQTLEGVRIVKREGVSLSGPPVPVTDGSSFTSGHVCNNVALAFMAYAVYGRFASFLWLWAAFISYSRIYTGAHFPTDVLASWILSPLYCLFILFCVIRAWDFLGPKCWPQLYRRHPELLGGDP